MTKEFQLRVDPRTAADNERVAAFVARQGNFDRGRIKLLQILKRSIDARQRRVMVNLTVRCFIDELPDNINRYEPYRYGDVSNAQTVVVVGAGPGGLFAALRLIELGLRPVVLERGKNVDDRRRDLARISRENIVDENSNYSLEKVALVRIQTVSCTREAKNAVLLTEYCRYSISSAHLKTFL